MAFIELHSIDYFGRTKPVLLNLHMFTDIFPTTMPDGTERTEVNLCSMDGENNPTVYHIEENYNMVKRMIRDAEIEERMMMTWQQH